MAIKQVVVDDLTGEENAQTRYFSLFGNDYEIDLTNDNADKLAQALEPFIVAARKKGQKRRTAATRVTTPSSKADLNAIREWAKSQGLPVSDRGRVRKDIVDKFNEAHAGKQLAAVAG